MVWVGEWYPYVHLGGASRVLIGCSTLVECCFCLYLSIFILFLKFRFEIPLKKKKKKKWIPRSLDQIKTALPDPPVEKLWFKPSAATGQRWCLSGFPHRLLASLAAGSVTSRLPVSSLRGRRVFRSPLRNINCIFMRLDSRVSGRSARSSICSARARWCLISPSQCL